MAGFHLMEGIFKCVCWTEDVVGECGRGKDVENTHTQ